MSENIYEFTWRDWSNWKLFVRRTAATNPLSIGIKLDSTERVMHLPSDPAELHKLTEAIHGRKIKRIHFEDEGEPTQAGVDRHRKIAAIVYEDEGAPQVRVRDDGNLIVEGVGIGGHWLPNSDPETVRNLGRRELLAAEAIARHIEARDAAAKEQERAEAAKLRAELERIKQEKREQAETLAKTLRFEWHQASNPDNADDVDWPGMAEHEREPWRAVARKVIADRAPQGEEAGR